MVEVESLEQHLGFSLLSGYREFITRFGEGDYCDLFRIYPPARIREEYALHREFLREHEYHQFFKGSDSVLSKKQLQECILIGDSHDGDYIEYHPSMPDKLFVLPRHDDKIHILKADFRDLHIWIWTEPRLKIFIPWQDRAYLSFRSTTYTIDQVTSQMKFQQRWGDLIMRHEQSDAWSWQLIFFLPAIGGRIQILQDEGVTRTIHEEHAIVTIQGNGVRRVFMDIHLDKDAVIDVKAFVDDLQAQGLGQFDLITQSR
jgi:hypothetical protein